MSHKHSKQIADPNVPIQRNIGEVGSAWISLFLAFVLALIASLGVLFIGEVMGQVPCIMCWYQRAFMFPLAAILGIATYQSDYAVWRYAVPLAGVGALLAFYHSLLYTGFISEGLVPCQLGVSCTSADMAIFGFLPLPVLSLVAFLTIALLTQIAKRKSTS